MKTKNNTILLAALLGVAVFFSQSCKKTEPPVVDFFFDVQGYMVTFTSQATNTTSYLWDFGDNQSSTEANPVHTYAKSGDYEVTLTAKGEGGEASQTKTVTIEPSAYEMLTGGSELANGKTWKISRTASTGDGVYAPIDPTLSHIYLPMPNDALDAYLGLGEEYDDEFTFKYDGSYHHDVKNGGGLTGYRYAGEYNLENMKTTDYGIFLSKFIPDEHATFTFAKDTTFTLQCAMEKVDSTYDVTFEHVSVIVPSDPEFFVLRDFTKTVIVKELAPDKMRVVVFLSSSDIDTIRQLPSHALVLTLETK